MNTHSRIFLLLAIGLFFYSVGLSQDDRPKPVLVDEMATRGDNCEDLLARLDGYFTELANNPWDQGYIIVYQAPESRSAGRSREHQVQNQAGMRRFDLSRITMVRGGVRRDAMVQLWRVPPGAEEPEILDDNAEFSTPEPPEPDPYAPYIYATEYSDGVQGCGGPLYDLEEYAAVLNEEGARGNIVIGQRTQALFREREREIRTELEQHGVARTRIRAFFKKVKADAAQEYTELWVLPAKQPTLPPRDPNRYTIIGDRNVEPPLSTEAVRAPAEINSATAPPPPPRVPKMISGGVLNGKASSLPKPVYPPAARAVRASGAVNVQVTVDEQGNVISAAAISGHPLLRASAVRAARQAKFSPTMLSAVPVKVTGIIVYNFVP